MMKLFDVADTRLKGYYVVAENEEDAKHVFTSLYPASKVKEVGEVAFDPKTSGYPSLKQILDGTEKGHLAMEFHPLSFDEMTSEVFLGKKAAKPADRWFFVKKA
jgi:hypothetical protein